MMLLKEQMKAYPFSHNERVIIDYILDKQINIKDYSVSSMLIFRITHNRYTIVELLLAFFVPLLLSLIIILIKEKKYDYI